MNASGPTKDQPVKWVWHFNHDFSINAEYVKSVQGEWVVEVRWKHKDSIHHQPLFVHLADGPEWLKSLAEFVAAIRQAQTNAQTGGNGP